MISLSKLKKVHSIVDKYFKLIEYVVTGENKPDDKILEEFKITKKDNPILERFFKYGKYEMGQNVTIKNKNIEEVAALVDKVNINSVDKNTLLYLKTSSLNGVKSFKDAFTNKILEEINKDQLRNILIENKDVSDTTEIAKKLEEATQNYKVNWKRIAHTELWNAKIYGQATAILNGECKGAELKGKTYVYKKVEPNACKYCKMHYLQPNGLPRLFTLDELISYGTNYGKKREDWNPVLGTMHPNCMCRLAIASTHELSPSTDLNKAIPEGSGNFSGTKQRDKTHLKYVKKLVNSNGKTYEQGFWVKEDQQKDDKGKKSDDDANLKNTKNNEIKYENVPNSEGQTATTLGANNSKLNIAGMNQYDASYLNKITTPLPTILGANNKVNTQLPLIETAMLPKAQREYYESIQGFDYNIMLSLKHNIGTEKAISYAKDTGFNIEVKDNSKAWYNTLIEVNKYLLINNNSNNKKNLQSILSVIFSYSYKNNGDLARCIHEISRGAYPTLGIFNEETNKIVDVVTQIEDKFCDTKGLHTMDAIMNQWFKSMENPAVPFLPLTLKTDAVNKGRGDWFFNEIEVQSANLNQAKEKKILNQIAARLIGKNADGKDRS